MILRAGLYLWPVSVYCYSRFGYFYLLSSRKTSFGSLFDLDFGGGEQPENFTAKPFKLATPAWIGMAMLVAAIPASMFFSERQDVVARAYGVH